MPKILTMPHEKIHIRHLIGGGGAPNSPVSKIDPYQSKTREEFHLRSTLQKKIESCCSLIIMS